MIAEAHPYTFLYEELRPQVIDERVALVGRSPAGKELISKLQTPPSGDTFKFFTQWRKFASVPSYSEQ